MLKPDIIYLQFIQSTVYILFCTTGGWLQKLYGVKFLPDRSYGTDKLSYETGLASFTVDILRGGKKVHATAARLINYTMRKFKRSVT